MRRFLLAPLATFFIALGPATLLYAQPGADATVWPIADAPANLKPVIARADAIIVAQHSALLRQLTRALSEGGATLAIQSCHLEATSNANWIGRKYGYAMGRTSYRLRSPTNKPRAWAARIVEKNAGRQAADVSGFAVDLGDRVGLMRPIAMQPMCQACHGVPDKMQPAIRSVLLERFPADRAVGFTNGEIRGCYWIEIPKAAGTRP